MEVLTWVMVVLLGDTLLIPPTSLRHLALRHGVRMLQPQLCLLCRELELRDIKPSTRVSFKHTRHSLLIQPLQQTSYLLVTMQIKGT